MGRNGSSDLEAVATVELADVINTWIELYKRTRPDPTWGAKSDDETVMVFGKRLSRQSCTSSHIVKEKIADYSAINYIVERSGVPDRRLYAIRKVLYKFTVLSVADKLLTAIDEQHALRDGRVRVVANPNISIKRLAAFMMQCAEEGYAPFDV